MKKTYQTDELAAAIPLPARVAAAMDDIAETMREGLLAMGVGAGPGVMQSLMDESVTALCGPKGRHQPDRAASGSDDGSVALGGRRVPVRRQRVRAVDGSGEMPIPAYELFTGSDLLGELAMGRMSAKLSTRRYRAGLEPVGAEVEAKSRSTSKSAVSRRFVAATETALGGLLKTDLSKLDLVALMVDGVHFAELGLDPLAGHVPAAVRAARGQTGVQDPVRFYLRCPAMPVTAMLGPRLTPRTLRVGLRFALGERGRLTLPAPPGVLQRPLQLLDPLDLLDDHRVLTTLLLLQPRQPRHQPRHLLRRRIVARCRRHSPRTDHSAPPTP